MRLYSRQEITIVTGREGWYLAIPEQFARIISAERLQDLFVKIFGGHSRPSIERFGSSLRINITGAPKEKIQEFVTCLENDPFGDT